MHQIKNIYKDLQRKIQQWIAHGLKDFALYLTCHQFQDIIVAFLVKNFNNDWLEFDCDFVRENISSLELYAIEQVPLDFFQRLNKSKIFRLNLILIYF